MLFLAVSFKGISQTEFAVKLTDNEAREIMKDLIEGDFCKEELLQTQFTLQLTEKKAVLQDSIIKNLNTQKVEYVSIVTIKDEQLQSQDKIIRATEKQLTQQKAVTWLYKFGTLVGVVVSGYLLLK